MADRPRFFDDLAGAAGGAFSALTGLREELHAVVRARIDEVLSSLDLVRRDELDVARELATRARMAQEDADARLARIEERLADLEKAVTAPTTHS
ncbi:accessory factor UbiK family protein [Asaia platycodi]|uniref:accessory factor UbiK family protein n=1 Tax=Asaia platycodi TaxID=610243 RepID=UPI00046EB459|nr:accessory factor UbiK family protein [Asaia platycodi]